MARSSLIGIDPAPTAAPGRDTASLGPGDSSDSGSDLVGVEDDSDPGVPVDVALRDDQPPPLPLGESTAAADGDAGVRDGADIGVDRVFTPDEADLGDEASQAALNLAGEALEDEDLDDELDGEEADEEGEVAQGDVARPPRRASRSAAPAAPRLAGDETDEDLPGEVAPAERRPGRD
jgi:hypothetical protein